MCDVIKETSSVVVIPTDGTWVSGERTHVYQEMNTCINQGGTTSRKKTKFRKHLTLIKLRLGRLEMGQAAILIGEV
jgi:hypothetical protein